MINCVLRILLLKQVFYVRRSRVELYSPIADASVRTGEDAESVKSVEKAMLAAATTVVIQ